MAAVVSSLAAFLIGYSVPGIPGVGRQGVVAQDHSEREIGAGDCSRDTVWRQAEQALGVDVADLVAKAIAQRQVSTNLAKAIADARPSCDSSDGAALAVASPPRARPALRSRRSRKSGRAEQGQQRVQFDLSKKTEHEVTPYAEVYGVHPRDFDFGVVRRGRRAGRAPPDAWRFVDPAGGGNAGAESDSDDDEDTMWAQGRRTLGLRGVPRHVYCTIFVISLLVHMLGADAFVDACSQLAKAVRM